MTDPCLQIAPAEKALACSCCSDIISQTQLQCSPWSKDRLQHRTGSSTGQASAQDRLQHRTGQAPVTLEWNISITRGEKVVRTHPRTALSNGCVFFLLESEFLICAATHKRGAPCELAKTEFYLVCRVMFRPPHSSRTIKFHGTLSTNPHKLAAINAQVSSLMVS